VSGGEPVTGVRTTVLGSPKPTTYQHYLTQTSDSKASAIHWDDSAASLRGFKRYFKHLVSYPAPPNNNAETVTQFQPASADARFKARIRFENLAPEELGALLMVTELPCGCAHQLGMAKPLGLGWFSAEIAVHRIDRKARYVGFFKDQTALQSGIEEQMDKTEIVSYTDKFAAWVLNDSKPEHGATDRLWNTPRMQELVALLKTDAPEHLTAEQWLQATRYLQLGPIRQGCIRSKPGAKNCEEYRSVYEPVNDQLIEYLEPRRPLPPATQVRAAGPEIPTDKSPRDLFPPEPAPPRGQFPRNDQGGQRRR